MARVSKGKLRFLRRLYLARMFILELGLPGGGIDLFKLATRSNLIAHRLPRKFKYPERTLKPCTYAEFVKHNVTINKILKGILQKQSQSIVHKPRVVCTEVDHSAPGCGDHKLVLPFPENGPIWHE